MVLILIGVGVYMTDTTQSESIIEDVDSASFSSTNDELSVPEEESLLEVNTSNQMEPTTLGIEVIAEGSGPEIEAGKIARVHYTGSLTDGTVFDSSIPRGEPIQFTLGVGQVIAGWDQGILGMKVGEKRRLTIPPHLGYGERGTPGGPIPPQATLLFDVELVGIQ